MVVYIAFALAAVAATVALYLWWLHLRQRQQLNQLMQRLDEIERSASAPGSTPRPADGPVGLPGNPAAAPDGDVLAGHTSHVRRVVDGEQEVANLADQAISVIHRRLEDPVTPALVAEDLCVSLRTLERGLASVLSCTPGQLILTMKMRMAQQMLRSGDYRVGEVAHRLAFADASHFSRRYKAFFRRPPSDEITTDKVARSA